MSEPLLSVRDLRVTYGPALALDGVSVDLDAGQVLAVVGPNGVGKSTFARAVCGLVPVAGGSIRFDGADVTKAAAHDVRKAGLVYLPEGRGVFPELSVDENLRMAACLLPRSERKAAAGKGLDMFPALSRRRDVRAGALSGGEQQMLSLCRAFVQAPKLIVADEMSLGLAPKLVDTVFEALQTLKDSGVTIVLIEQFVHRALRFADTAMLLASGVVSWKGETADGAEEIVARYLGNAEAA